MNNIFQKHFIHLLLNYMTADLAILILPVAHLNLFQISFLFALLWVCHLAEKWWDGWLFSTCGSCGCAGWFFIFIILRGWLIDARQTHRLEIKEHANTLWPNDAIWRHKAGSTLAYVMALLLDGTNLSKPLPEPMLRRSAHEWKVIKAVHDYCSEVEI